MPTQVILCMLLSKFFRTTASLSHPRKHDTEHFLNLHHFPLASLKFSSNFFIFFLILSLSSERHVHAGPGYAAKVFHQTCICNAGINGFHFLPAHDKRKYGTYFSKCVFWVRSLLNKCIFLLDKN